jgi:heat shock protein 5
VNNPYVFSLDSNRFTDKEVQRDVKMFPFKVVNVEGKPCIEVSLKDGEKIFQAEEVSAMVLTKMKETAEAYLGKDIKHAVVTVPGKLSNNSSKVTHPLHQQLISMMHNAKLQKMLEPLLV